MAAILGEAMLLSGAAESIAGALLRVMGAARAHWAFFITSFFLTIPVFFETTFYLLSPLAKAVARQTKRNYLLLVMCAVAGGTITHSLVPPTPGPVIRGAGIGSAHWADDGHGLPHRHGRGARRERLRALVEPPPHARSAGGRRGHRG